MKVDDAYPPGSPTFSSPSSDAPAIPLEEYRLTGEPPTFSAQELAHDRLGTRLLRVVTEVQDSGVRSAFHVAVQEISDTVLAHAIYFAPGDRDPTTSFLAITSNGPLGACYNEEGGFAMPARIKLAPLRIDYEVEPSFELLGDGPQRSASYCVVASHAVWRAGKGFVLQYESAACSTTQFRAAHVRPDGSLEVRKHTPTLPPR